MERGEGSLKHARAEGKGRDSLLLGKQLWAHWQGVGTGLDIMLESGRRQSRPGSVVQLRQSRSRRGRGIDLGSINLLNVERESILIVGRRGGGGGRGLTRGGGWIDRKAKGSVKGTNGSP